MRVRTWNLAAWAIVGLLLAGSAGATSGEYVEVTCPVCGHGFEGWQAHSTNNLGGQDRDFLEHAAGGQVFLMACWTCPRCLWTGFEDGFEAGAVEETLAARIRAERPLEPRAPVDASVRRTTDIPALVRWDLYVQRLALEDAPVGERAWACLRAAQTQRFDHVWPEALAKARSELWDAEWRTLPLEERRGNRYDAVVRMAEALVTEARDQDAELDDAARALRLLVAAHAWKGRGEDPDATRVLDLLAATVPERSEAVREVEAEIRRRIAVEREYGGRAMAHLEAQVADEATEAEERLALRYLLGELERKQGRHEEARRRLEALLAEEDLPDWVREWGGDALRRAKVLSDD